jgi:hypothetical protein
MACIPRYISSSKTICNNDKNDPATVDAPVGRSHEWYVIALPLNICCDA